MKISRKYIQYNNLVIDGFDMLESADLSGSFKTSTTQYSYGHGSYVSFRGNNQLSSEQSLSLTLNLDTRKISCKNRRYYRDWVNIQLSKPGKLWCVQGDQILYAYAYVSDFSESYQTSRNKISIDISMVLYEGVFHKADILKIFLTPYNPCEFFDCEVIINAQECHNYCGVDCAICAAPGVNSCLTCSCKCQESENLLTFCEIKDKAIKSFNNNCAGDYRIIYDCKRAIEIHGEQMLGDMICKAEICQSIISGQFYSDTILDTDEISLTFKGKFINPRIVINGNVLDIKGEYDGELQLKSNYELYYITNECCEPDTIDDENIIIPDDSTYGFTIHHGYNSVTVETNDCCSSACVFIKVDSITI